MTMVRIIKGPPGCKTLGWVCEVDTTTYSDSLSRFMSALGHGDALRLRTCDETVHPEGYFYVYARNTEPVEG